MTPRLEMIDVGRRFGSTVALDGVSLSVAPGEIHGLVGENGAGKSTLMKILSGAIPPDMGSMSLDGQTYRPKGPLEARQAGVSMIYQELSLSPHLSVSDNIVLGVEPARFGWINRGRVRQLARDALGQLDHAEIDPNTRVSQLPVSAQQIVEIARALATGCRVLILDEPTSSLSQQDVARLFQILQRLKGQGHAIIYISHFIEEVSRIADRFTVLRDGQMAGSGPMAGATLNGIVGMMVGRTVAELYPRSPRSPGEPILEVDHLAASSRLFSSSFTLHRGEVLGIAGLMGSGRTELLRAIFGLDAIRAGHVRLGIAEGPCTPRERWRQGAGFVSEDRKVEGLALSLSLADNMTLTQLQGLGPCHLVLPSRQDQSSRRWIRELDIRCAGPRQAVGALSGGNQQKVALARLLHHDVDVLLLDEPTRGIDVGSKAQIYQLIDRLATGSAETGQRKAILMVSSYLPELLGVCDRIAVMCRGKLSSPDPVAGLDEHRLMLKAAGGEENRT